MIAHKDVEDAALLRSLIHAKKIVLAGNINLKIYGRLNCKQGKRMLRKNRMFFTSKHEALEAGYRPCGHCMKDAYKAWKTKHTS